MKKKTKSSKKVKRQNYLDKIVQMLVLILCLIKCYTLKLISFLHRCMKIFRNESKDKKINFEEFKNISAHVVNDIEAEVDYHLLFLLLKPE